MSVLSNAENIRFNGDTPSSIFSNGTLIWPVVPTPTPTSSITPTNTVTPTVTITPTNTVTPTNTITPTETVTPTPSISSSLTPTPTSTITQTPSITSTITPTPTSTYYYYYLLNCNLGDNKYGRSTNPSLSGNIFNVNTNTCYTVVGNDPGPSYDYDLDIASMVVDCTDILCGPTPTPTSTVTPTPSISSSLTPTQTPSITPTNTVTPTPSITNSETPTTTPTPTKTITPTSTITPTPSITPTMTVTPTTPSLVTTGLIMQLDANNISSYPGTGTTVNDITGGYNHTLTTAPYTVLNGIKCFDCTTGTNRVVVNGTGPTLPTTGYTYITWTRLINNNSVFRTLLHTSSPRYTPITISNGGSILGYWDSAFRSSGYDASAFQEVWTQFAIVGDNVSQTFYINGSQVGNPIAQGVGGNIHWGWGNNDTVSQPWGHLANLYLYNRKLSLSEITQQYNFLAPIFVEVSPTPTNTVTPTATVTPSLTVTPTPSVTASGITTSNLILHYDPSNLSSYPGSGTTITDLSGNGRNGIMSNITYTSPYFTYNGSSSQIAIADNAALEPGSGDWTVEVWVNQAVSGNDVVLGKFNAGGLSANVGYSIRTLGTSFYAQYGSGAGSGATLIQDSTSYSKTINTWHQLVYVFTNVAANTFETFVNGSSIGSVGHSLASILNTTTGLYIGSYNNGEYEQWFDGKIGITRLYNRALTSSEVLNNYNVDKSKYGL